jgi:hypothetical protein
VIVATLVLLVLAVVILAFVLEPVVRARMDRVEIDAAVKPVEIPDFRELLAAEQDGETAATPAASDLRAPASNPEPAEHRS